MTQLPEPNFIERDPDKITQEWISLYEEKSGKTLQPAQIERLMIDVGAYRETLLRIDIQETAKQNLLSYANIDNLEHIGEPLGVKKLLANSSVTTIRFQVDTLLDFDINIPQGTEIESKDGLFVFETTNDAILFANNKYIDVKASCQTKGIASNNYAINSINNLITPLDYINDVSNITITSGGVDDEDVENLRERIRQAPEKFSNAGSRGAYKYHTLTAHQSITDVAILSPSAGIVNIYPLTEDGNPTEEVINIVQEYLSDDQVRPLTDFVQVLPPEKINFSIKSTIYLYKDADIDSVLTTIENKLKEYKRVLSNKLGKSVVQTQIITILNSVYGVFRVEIYSPNDINILEHQWANLEDWDITIGGYADE